MRRDFLRRTFARGLNVLPCCDTNGKSSGMARTTFACQRVIRPGQIPVACETLQFGAVIVRGTGARHLSDDVVGRQRVAGDDIAGSIGAAIQINGGKNSLKCIDQKPLLTSAPGCLFPAA